MCAFTELEKFTWKKNSFGKIVDIYVESIHEIE